MLQSNLDSWRSRLGMEFQVNTSLKDPKTFYSTLFLLQFNCQPCRYSIATFCTVWRVKFIHEAKFYQSDIVVHFDLPSLCEHAIHCYGSIRLVQSKFKLCFEKLAGQQDEGLVVIQIHSKNFQMFAIRGWKMCPMSFND